ncbi:unnamed protein product [Symbiodinium sp. CCMP2592]|nr:unnamed protein product [Symbiodinium sp. CCMP2592]
MGWLSPFGLLLFVALVASGTPDEENEQDRQPYWRCWTAEEIAEYTAAAWGDDPWSAPPQPTWETPAASTSSSSSSWCPLPLTPTFSSTGTSSGVSDSSGGPTTQWDLDISWAVQRDELRAPTVHGGYLDLPPIPEDIPIPFGSQPPESEELTVNGEGHEYPGRLFDICQTLVLYSFLVVCTYLARLAEFLDFFADLEEDIVCLDVILPLSFEAVSVEELIDGIMLTGLFVVAFVNVLKQKPAHGLKTIRLLLLWTLMMPMLNVLLELQKKSATRNPLRLKSLGVTCTMMGNAPSRLLPFMVIAFRLGPGCLHADNQTPPPRRGAPDLGGMGPKRQARKAARMKAYAEGTWRPVWLLDYVKGKQARDELRTRDSATVLADMDPKALAVFLGHQTGAESDVPEPALSARQHAANIATEPDPWANHEWHTSWWSFSVQNQSEEPADSSTQWSGNGAWGENNWYSWDASSSTWSWNWSSWSSSTSTTSSSTWPSLLPNEGLLPTVRPAEPDTVMLMQMTGAERASLQEAGVNRAGVDSIEQLLEMGSLVLKLYTWCSYDASKHVATCQYNVYRDRSWHNINCSTGYVGMSPCLWSTSSDTCVRDCNLENVIERLGRTVMPANTSRLSRTWQVPPLMFPTLIAVLSPVRELLIVGLPARAAGPELPQATKLLPRVDLHVAPEMLVLCLRLETQWGMLAVVPQLVGCHMKKNVPLKGSFLVIRDAVNRELVHATSADVVELLHRLIARQRRLQHLARLTGIAIEETLTWIQVPAGALAFNAPSMEQTLWSRDKQLHFFNLASHPLLRRFGRVFPSSLRTLWWDSGGEAGDIMLELSMPKMEVHYLGDYGLRKTIKTCISYKLMSLHRLRTCQRSPRLVLFQHDIVFVIGVVRSSLARLQYYNYRVVVPVQNAVAAVILLQNVLIQLLPTILRTVNLMLKLEVLDEVQVLILRKKNAGTHEVRKSFRWCLLKSPRSARWCPGGPAKVAVESSGHARHLEALPSEPEAEAAVDVLLCSGEVHKALRLPGSKTVGELLTMAGVEASPWQPFAPSPGARDATGARVGHEVPLHTLTNLSEKNQSLELHVFRESAFR